MGSACSTQQTLSAEAPKVDAPVEVPKAEEPVTEPVAADEGKAADEVAEEAPEAAPAAAQDGLGDAALTEAPKEFFENANAQEEKQEENPFQGSGEIAAHTEGAAPEVFEEPHIEEAAPAVEEEAAAPVEEEAAAPAAAEEEAAPAAEE
eukprot:gene512-284_t